MVEMFEDLYMNFDVFRLLWFMLSLSIALQAGKMGYSRVGWFVMIFLSYNLWLITFVIFLAVLPDRTIDKKREQERALLATQLAQRPTLGTNEASSVPRQTISDDETIR